MSISKAKVTPLAVNLGMSQGISDEAIDALNAMNDRILAKVFPKDANLNLDAVRKRITGMKDIVLDEVDLKAFKAMGSLPDLISFTTANKMIRAYAGNVKVPDDTKAYTSFFIQKIVDAIVVASEKKASARGVSKISLKDIRDALNDNESGIHSLKKIATGGVRKRLSSPRKRLSAKKSGSKKKKSKSKKSKKSKSKSKSTKKCPKGKRAVHSYKSSSGKKVKAYCRKKSVSRK